MSDFNAKVIEEFRANGGKVGGPFGEEWDELFDRQAGIFSAFGEYAEKTSRTIPVVLLNPRG